MRTEAHPEIEKLIAKWRAEIRRLAQLGYATTASMQVSMWCDELDALSALSGVEIARVTKERDIAWGELGFMKNDLGNALHRAEAAEAECARLRQSQVVEHYCSDGGVVRRMEMDTVGTYVCPACAAEVYLPVSPPQKET